MSICCICEKGKEEFSQKTELLKQSRLTLEEGAKFAEQAKTAKTAMECFSEEGGFAKKAEELSKQAQEKFAKARELHSQAWSGKQIFADCAHLDLQKTVHITPNSMFPERRDSRLPKRFKLSVIYQTPRLENHHREDLWCHSCDEKTQRSVKEFFSQFANLTTPIPHFCAIESCRMAIIATRPCAVSEDNPVFLKHLSDLIPAENTENYLFDLRVTPYLSKILEIRQLNERQGQEGALSLCVVYRYRRGENPLEGNLVVNNVMDIEKDTTIYFKPNETGTSFEPVVNA